MLIDLSTVSLDLLRSLRGSTNRLSMSVTRCSQKTCTCCHDFCAKPRTVNVAEVINCSTNLACTSTLQIDSFDKDM